MKIFTCKKTMAAVVLSCLFSTAYAQKSLTVTTEAGKLSEKISEADRYNVTELKISGSINGTDILLLRSKCRDQWQALVARYLRGKNRGRW